MLELRQLIRSTQLQQQLAHDAATPRSSDGPPHRGLDAFYYERISAQSFWCSNCHQYCTEDEYVEHSINKVCRRPHRWEEMPLPSPRPATYGIEKEREVSLTCLHCNRTFLSSAWKRHVEVCERVFGTKRPVFRARAKTR